MGLREDIIDALIQAVAEDYTRAELFNYPFMHRELKRLLDLPDFAVPPLLLGAIQIQELWDGRLPFWKSLLRIH